LSLSRNLPGTLCNDNVSVDQDLTPAAQTSTSLQVYCGLLPCVPRIDTGLAVRSSHLQSLLHWAGEPEKTQELLHSDLYLRIVPRSPLCATSTAGKGGTTHHHHHRLFSHPIHVEGYARYHCYDPLGSFPEHHTSRARSIRQPDSHPCNPTSTTRRGRARITRGELRGRAVGLEPSSQLEFRRSRGVEQDNLLRGTVLVFCGTASTVGHGRANFPAPTVFALRSPRGARLLCWHNRVHLDS
jgi:hypothetical protein